jgi:hypothetical protein
VQRVLKTIVIRRRSAQFFRKASAPGALIALSCPAFSRQDKTANYGKESAWLDAVGRRFVLKLSVSHGGFEGKNEFHLYPQAGTAPVGNFVPALTETVENSFLEEKTVGKWNGKSRWFPLAAG